MPAHARPYWGHSEAHFRSVREASSALRYDRVGAVSRRRFECAGCKSVCLQIGLHPGVEWPLIGEHARVDVEVRRQNFGIAVADAEGDERADIAEDRCGDFGF